MFVFLDLNGGPGCSSALSLFLGHGPFRIAENLTLYSNPFTWNDKYHLLFLDSPVGAVKSNNHKNKHKQM